MDGLGRGFGFLAALMFPSGVEDVVMGVKPAPEVDIERGVGRGGAREGEEAGGELGNASGDDGDGEPNGLSESKSSAPGGVEAGDAMMNSWGRGSNRLKEEKRRKGSGKRADKDGEGKRVRSGTVEEGIERSRTGWLSSDGRTPGGDFQSTKRALKGVGVVAGRKVNCVT